METFKRTLIAALLVGAMCMTGCGGDGGCDTDEDCPSGETCVLCTNDAIAVTVCSGDVDDDGECHP